MTGILTNRKPELEEISGVDLTSLEDRDVGVPDSNHRAVSFVVIQTTGQKPVLIICMRKINFSNPNNHSKCRVRPHLSPNNSQDRVTVNGKEGVYMLDTGARYSTLNYELPQTLLLSHMVSVLGFSGQEQTLPRTQPLPVQIGRQTGTFFAALS